LCIRLKLSRVRLEPGHTAAPLKQVKTSSSAAGS
jgi:hypothetical protein